MSYIGTEPKDIRSFGRTKFDYTATQGQTAFTGADDDGKVLAFTVGQIEVYVNGILMDDSDFTTTGTGTVTLASAANLNDVVNVVSFETNIPDSNYVPASGGTFTGNVTHSGTVTNSGNVTVGGTLGVTGAVNVSGNILPTVDNTSDLGSTSKKLKDLYLSSGINIYNSSTDAVDIKGTGSRCEIDNPANNAILLKTGGTTRVRIDSNGLKFNGDTAAANALSDYETGTFQMTANGVSGGARGSGIYVKVGNLVHFQWYSGAMTVTSSTPVLTGLPFTSTDPHNSAAYSGFVAYHNTYVSNANTGYININSTSLYFTTLNSTGGPSINTGSNIYCMVAGTYYAA